MPLKKRPILDRKRFLSEIVCGFDYEVVLSWVGGGTTGTTNNESALRYVRKSCSKMVRLSLT